MKLDPAQVKALAKKYIDGAATPEEARILHEWYNTINAGDTEMVMTPLPETSAKLGQEILGELKTMIAADRVNNSPLIRYLFPWRKVAAAIVLISACIIAYLVIRPERKEPVAFRQVETIREIQAPQRSAAVITLSNGRKIFLDSVTDGSLAIQGNVSLVKMADGHIAYTGKGNELPLEYNTLTVPRGSRVVSLTLTDGTRVWLNAASSLRYPVSFGAAERTVDITGEAYFEVAKDAGRKFLVRSSGGMTTEVLGTHFNVNSYDDEETMAVTLLEGSVLVKNDQSGIPATIKPGQQARSAGGDAINILNHVDLEEVMAWKNEQFIMKGADLGALARQMARWYDVEVFFNGKMTDKKFGGSIDRNVNLSTMLKALKENGIESDISGRTVNLR